jgi:NAD(P)-dependent dehydrogenase (short-subunit alcohol dehydrogenase family)
MPKVFITGSSDGLGLFSAKELLSRGYEVVFHARNQKRAEELKSQFPQAVVLIANLENFEEVKRLAAEVNALGNFEVIIHNAGVFKNDNTAIFRVNVLAVYLLTALIKRPKRLIYIGSNMHPQGRLDIPNLSLEIGVDYSTSKLQVLMLSLYVSRKWNDVYVNTVDPGWVKTKMANYNAPDSLEDGTDTQIWLATKEEAKKSGKYFFHLKEIEYLSLADDEKLQEQLVNKYKEITGVRFPIN